MNMRVFMRFWSRKTKLHYMHFRTQCVSFASSVIMHLIFSILYEYMYVTIVTHAGLKSVIAAKINHHLPAQSVLTVVSA